MCTMDSASIDAIHMNGIKSKYLYDILKGIVREKNYDVLETINVSEFLDELLDHMVNTIPNELFQTKVNNGRHTVGRKEDSEENEEAVYGTDIDDANDVHTRQLDDLKRISTHLTINFKDKSQLPFTIVRICELCFDPFHYFKTYELDKFVNALQKCCLVRGAWRRYELKDVRELSNSQSDKEHIDCDQNDVALSKIPWLDEKMVSELTPFIKEIDTIMSVNLSFEDDEMDDDDDDNLKNENNDRIITHQDDNIIVEEYYENEDKDDENTGFSNQVINDNNDSQEDDDEDSDYIEEDEGDEDEDEDDDDEEEEEEEEDEDEDKHFDIKVEEEAVKEDANTTRNELMNVSNNSDDSSLQNDTGIAISSQNDTRDLSKRRLPLSDENDGNYANPASFSKRNKASES